MRTLDPKLLSQPRTPCIDVIPSAQEAPGPARAYRVGEQVRVLGDGRSKKIVRFDLPEFSSTSVFSSARSRDHVPEDVLDVDQSEELAWAGQMPGTSASSSKCLV